MGLVGIGLGEGDQQTLRTLEPEIIRTLRHASANIQRGQGRAESQSWFGDRSELWMGFLARNLWKMANVLNTERIEVHGLPAEGSESDAANGTEPAREPAVEQAQAAAAEPAEVHNADTDEGGALEQSLEIRLDVAWYRVPLFRPGTTPVASKFHAIVHELTHLILHTQDMSPACGAANCLKKAGKPEHAKRNADNWAFFIDDFR